MWQNQISLIYRNQPLNSIQVKRGDFIGLLKAFKRLCKPYPGEEAVLRFSDGTLLVELGGVAQECPASGSGEIHLRFAGYVLLAIAKVPPQGDPVEIRFEEGEEAGLRIGTTVIKCKPQHVGVYRIELPMHATTSDMLILRLRYSDEEIAESGYEKSVGKAMEKRNRAIVKACKPLDEFHVSHLDLAELIDKCLLREITKSHDEQGGLKTRSLRTGALL